MTCTQAIKKYILRQKDEDKDQSYFEEVDVNAMDLIAAVDYALNVVKKETNYIKMELLISCE